jgi:ABC-2 type transport system ATP-binding protein
MDLDSRHEVVTSSPMTEPLLQVAGLRKSYGDVLALESVDLEVRAGEIVGLVGANGAGKTTLISLIAGLHRPDAGSVRIAGVDALARPHTVRRLLGLAPQEVGVYPILTVRQNLEFFGRLSGLSGRELRNRIDDVASGLDLGGLMRRVVKELSGGERRRVHVGMALLHRPRLLLLDEPTSGVDVHTRARFHEAVRTAARAGAGVLYSTHYLAEIEALDASVVILERGRILARGGLDELTSAHSASILELRFEGGPPHDVELDGWAWEGDRLRNETGRGAAALVALLGRLGTDAERIRSIHVIRPSLETVYLRLTGRRSAGDTDEEGDHDVATA